jgi:hypothetical protein
MALTLANPLGATDTEVVVTGQVTDEITVGYGFRLDDEALQIADFVRYGTRGTGPGKNAGRDRTRWLVRRGLGGSVAASHAQGAAIVGATDAWKSGTDVDHGPPWADSGGGGGGGAAPTLVRAVVTPAQVQTWDTVAVPLVPAPGPGMIVVPYSILLRRKAGAAYTLVGGLAQVDIGPRMPTPSLFGDGGSGIAALLGQTAEGWLWLQRQGADYSVIAPPLGLESWLSYGSFTDGSGDLVIDVLYFVSAALV